MSFFEVYNERIHDLLVCKGENGQRKQTVRFINLSVFNLFLLMHRMILVLKMVHGLITAVLLHDSKCFHVRSNCVATY